MKDFAPFFPAWLHLLAPMGRRRSTTPLPPPVRTATLTQIEDRFSPALTPDLLQKSKAGDHSREAIYPLFRTFWCWVWQILQANTSCRQVVRQVQALFALQNGRDVDAASGAYCEARRKLPTSLLEKAFRLSAQSAQARMAPAQLLQARPLQAVDGSGSRLQDTPRNRAAYPPSKNQKQGCGFPFMRIVVVFCLASGAILAKAIGSLHQSELSLLFSLRSCFQKHDIVLADRAYGNYVMAALFQSLGIDVIARVATGRRRVDFRQAKTRFKKNEALFHWLKPSQASPLLRAAEWAALPGQITVRILRIQIHRQGFRTRKMTLVTTLIDPLAYPAAEIIAAYLRRWRLEMCLDDLKTTLGMEQLHCLSPKMVEKELLVFLITHNLLRWLMAEVAQTQAVDLERISFKGGLDAFRQWTQAMAQTAKNKKKQRAQLWEKLLQTLAADLVPERPGRIEPRAVKRKTKYPCLNKPRHQYVERWSRNERRVRANAKKSAC